MREKNCQASIDIELDGVRISVRLVLEGESGPPSGESVNSAASDDHPPLPAWELG